LLRRAAEVYDTEIEALEVDVDHVHMCIAVPPQESVGEAVQRLKSLSARHMFKRFPYLRKTFWSNEMWSPSYFVRSIGDRVTAEMVKRYIEDHDSKAALGPVQAQLFPKGKAKRRT
jgi:putative transposase